MSRANEAGRGDIQGIPRALGANVCDLAGTAKWHQGSVFLCFGEGYDRADREAAVVSALSTISTAPPTTCSIVARRIG